MLRELCKNARLICFAVLVRIQVVTAYAWPADPVPDYRDVGEWVCWLKLCPARATFIARRDAEAPGIGTAAQQQQQQQQLLSLCRVPGARLDTPSEPLAVTQRAA